MKQGLEGQTRAQMMGDFMNICIGLQEMIVSSANQYFISLAKKFQTAKLKFKILSLKWFSRLWIAKVSEKQS